jgi:hypothetical protein
MGFLSARTAAMRCLYGQYLSRRFRWATWPASAKPWGISSSCFVSGGGIMALVISEYVK